MNTIISFKNLLLADNQSGCIDATRIGNLDIRRMYRECGKYST
jgi:hypothetical protein